MHETEKIQGIRMQLAELKAYWADRSTSPAERICACDCIRAGLALIADLEGR